jgi:hypothetical protein
MGERGPVTVARACSRWGGGPEPGWDARSLRAPRRTVAARGHSSRNGTIGGPHGCSRPALVLPRGPILQLSPPSRSGPPPSDVASALTAARATWGQRPAITVLSPRGREEQGFASLAQWAAKGAHLLELDLLLGPGDTIHLDAPLSWTSAAVCLAAWWSGIGVTIGQAPPGGVAVVHSSRAVPPGVDELFRLGDAVDGSPAAGLELAGEPWVRAVQTFPDQPPAPRGGASSVALDDGRRTLDQAALLAAVDGLGDGTLGLGAEDVDPLVGLGAVALRPLVVGRPTVVLQDVDRSAAAGEKVTSWR